MRPLLHAGTNLDPLFNLWASSTLLSKSHTLQFFLSNHHSGSCSPFLFAVFIPLFSLFFLSTLLCFIPTSTHWLDFNRLILITHFVVSHSTALLSVLLLQCLCFLYLSLGFLPAYSHFCRYLISCLLSDLFLHSAPLFTLLSGFSLSSSTHDPFPSYCFLLPVSLYFFVLPLDSLSFYTMNPEGFIFFPSIALPLSLIPHLHQLPSRSLSLSPSCFLSLFHYVVFTFTFCAFFSSHIVPPLSSCTVLSHFCLSHSQTCNPSFLSPEHCSFPFVPLKPSFFLHFSDGYTHAKHI